MADPQRFVLEIEGRRHEVEIVAQAVRRTATWSVDGVPVATRTSAAESLDLEAGEGHGSVGRVRVRLTALGRARRATWFAPGDDLGVRAALDRDGIDLDPEPGSPAAAYADRLAAHPTRFTLIQTGLGVAKVVVPILLGLLAVRLAISIPWPSVDLPSIPWPDWHLPSIPWPDLPSIPWPDWHLPSIAWPGWVRWAADHVSYVWPAVLAFLLARTELRRRRQQEERKAARTGTSPPSA